jgi:hypothetical protein
MLGVATPQFGLRRSNETGGEEESRRSLVN